MSSDIKQNYAEAGLRFEDLGLDDDVLAGVREAGFEYPTPIQGRVIPVAVEGRDLIGLAQTGSGKTAAFCLPVAQRLTEGQGFRGLILCPTREIALQTKAFLDVFGQAHHLSTACIIGGVSFQPQIRALRNRPDIVVATPGRLLDHASRGNVSLSRVRELVMDEADHMLDLGFLPQIQKILNQLPKNRHTMLFSATMPPPIERLAQRYLDDPVLVDLRPSGRAAEGIDHRLYLVREKDKKACAMELLRHHEGSTLVFTRRKSDAEWLCRVLESEGFAVERIHSNRSQSKRTHALEGFRRGDHRILVATDIAARGIDIPEIEHIMNFDLPDNVEDYIHRAGRTARGANKGIVSSVATWLDKTVIKQIERTLEKPLPRCSVEGVEEWVERQSLQDRKRRSLRR